MPELTLHGCTPEPLMNYLKALGVFRILSEQADPECRAAWRGGVFVLKTRFTESELLSFLCNEYAPSPIVSPWNAEGGFLSETGKCVESINEIKTSQNPRLYRLRDGIDSIEKIPLLSEFESWLRIAKALGKKKKARTATKPELDELKWATKRVKSLKENILSQIRKDFPEACLGWFDACLQIGDKGFFSSPILGSGGVDGRLEFSANFHNNILLAIENQGSEGWIDDCLFARGNARLEPVSIGQFSPGHVGGPNATQGFVRDSAINPWDFILMIEGAPLMAGAISRRCRSTSSRKPTFPFSVYPTACDSNSVTATDSNSARGEVWLPLWEKYLLLSELLQIFGEGRAEWNGAQSRTSVDFAKAAAIFGVDRGISSFTRHSFLQRNGLSYLAAPLGRFDVRVREDVHLLREADGWIDRYRNACCDTSPARFASALRRIDSSVFDFCQHGETERFQAILIALGRAEREISLTVGKVGKDGNCRPLHGLSSDWVRAADDHSAEFQIAAALASIQGVPGKYPSLRGNLEPLDPKERLPKWLAATPTAVWNRGSLAANLLAVLERRLLDTERLSLDYPPLIATSHAHPQAIAAFLAGHLDESRIEDLLWGLLCCEIPSMSRPAPGTRVVPLPRSWLLLKAVFSGIGRDMPAPGSLDPSQRHIWDALRNVHPDPRILHLLRANSAGEALTLAARRCRHADLSPAAIDWTAAAPPSSVCSHLAAALLIPIEPRAMVRLWQQIARPVQ